MKKWFLRIALILGALSGIAFVVIWGGFRASLPQLEGTVSVTGINETVLLERDSDGNATITASSRNDLAYVSGFLHAQERFFQMDLSRRMAAGELSELFGTLALNADRENRIHRFRSRAVQAITMLSNTEKDLLNRYVQGVNDGLASLGSKPFEYWLLNTEPTPWKGEDTFLAVYAMFFTLQHSRGEFEWQNHLLRSSLPTELADFLLPSKTMWDAPLEPDEEPYRAPDIPSASLLSNSTPIALSRNDAPMLGSNNWAVTGELTETGAGMVSNDMHLSIRAPSIWYKLRMKLNDGSLDITGVSLPGAPAIVVGSNGAVAWGFTNTNIDTSDIIELRINPENENQYLTADGYKDFVTYNEIISIAGAVDEVYSVKETIWGPVMDMGDGKSYAYRWIAHVPDGVNLSLLKMEQVKSVDAALSIAGEMGIPAQNAMIVDKIGNAAWTIFGKIPARPDGDYGKIMDWSDGQAAWTNGYETKEYPRIINPQSNRLWTANARVVSGDALNKVGTGRYDLGARAKQIRDRLEALESPVKETDLYRIMLDSEAIFLARWQQQLSDVLRRTQDDAFRPFLERIENWSGFADKESVGYRLVKEYRDRVFETLMGNAVSACMAFDENCDYEGATKQWEAPLWQLVTERPAGWLPGGGDDWQFFFEQKAFEAWKPVLLGEIDLDDFTQGKNNISEIGHPLSSAVPLLSHLTDMPRVEQSGDTENLPYIAGRRRGQSERIVVSPGHEESGIMNLPAGQSGHPLSPYYGAGHEDWQEGNMTPFLPQQTKWMLEFQPSG